MGGSVPQPVPIFNPSPIQSSGGFNIPTPVPTSLGAPMELSAPVEVPVFAKETPIVIGGEQLPMPVMEPVKELAPIPIREKQPVVVPVKPPIIEDKPIVMPRPPPAQPISIISTKPPLTADKSDSKFILPPPPARSDMKSTASMISELSKETGITSKKVADFLFPKKKEPASGSKSVVSDLTKSAGPSTIFAENWKNELKAPKAPVDNDPLFFTKEDLSVAGPPPSLPTISTRSGFYNEPFKGSFANEPIIVPPKEVVVLKKPELKRSNPYDIFSDNDANRSIASEKSLIVIPKTANEKPSAKPPKKRVVMSSDSERELNIIPLDEPAGRLPTVKERRSNYITLAELQEQAVKNKISITRANGKKKTREELRLEILG